MSKNTDALINGLTEELKPMKCMGHPCMRILPWILGAVAYMAGVAYLLELRGDVHAIAYDTVFLFEVALMAAVFVSASLTAAWMCIPDMQGKKWMIAVPVTLSGVFLLWTGLRTFTEGETIPHINWMHHCFTDAMLMGFVPAIAMVFITRRGATTRPYLMALMNVLAVTGLAYIGMRFSCGADSVGHVFIYHVFPFVVGGTLLGMLGRKIYKW